MHWSFRKYTLSLRRKGPVWRIQWHLACRCQTPHLTSNFSQWTLLAVLQWKFHLSPKVIFPLNHHYNWDVCTPVDRTTETANKVCYDSICYESVFMNYEFDLWSFCMCKSFRELKKWFENLWAHHTIRSISQMRTWQAGWEYSVDRITWK